ncbi:MAG: hypothetical protein D6729_14785 [Deltaproteobacteria bacterium]|nr:MAG: hypothetical protein D6729_14785 [Deltaproteobacteria bacterium]
MPRTASYTLGLWLLLGFLCAQAGCRSAPEPRAEAPAPTPAFERRSIGPLLLAIRPLPPSAGGAAEAIRRSREEALARGWPVVGLAVLYPSGTEAYLALVLSGPVAAQAPWRVRQSPPMEVAVWKVPADPMAAAARIRQLRAAVIEAGEHPGTPVIARPVEAGTEVLLPLERP